MLADANTFDLLGVFNGSISMRQTLLCLSKEADILWLCQIALDGYRLRAEVSNGLATVCSASCSADGLW